MRRGRSPRTVWSHTPQRSEQCVGSLPAAATCFYKAYSTVSATILQSRRHYISSIRADVVCEKCGLKKTKNRFKSWSLSFLVCVSEAMLCSRRMLENQCFWQQLSKNTHRLRRLYVRTSAHLLGPQSFNAAYSIKEYSSNHEDNLVRHQASF